MTAQTFGRKGRIGEPAQRRAGLVAHQPRSFQPARREAASADNDVEARRTAFVAEEQVRNASESPSALPSVAIGWALRAFKAKAGDPTPPTDRSLKVAYSLWFLLGLAGGHRFYLRRPVTGSLQALLLCGYLGAVMAQYYWAFAGLGLSWLWMLADGIRLRTLFMTAGKR